MEIRPFRGWQYDAARGGDITSLIGPPYDVLSAEDKRDLLARDENNIVAVDLPHVPPSEAGPDEVYQAAAETLRQWKSSGRLRQADRPALYAYEQTFTWAGTQYVRRAMICGVRATELGADVLGHERVFGGPKADRLRLTRATRMQLSPILGFYDDAGGGVAEALFSTAPPEPDLRGKLRDVTEKIWAVTDEAVIADVAAGLRDTPVFIADGHHRYATALAYRDDLPAARTIGADHEAGFVMFCLVPADDAGLLILPTHRVIRNLAADFSIHDLMRAAGEFSWRRCSVTDADLQNADAFLRRYGTGAMAFVEADPAEVWIARLTDPDAMAAAAPDKPEIWRRLDVAVLHKLIIDRAISPWRTEKMSVEYTPDGRAVLAACHAARAQLGVCLQATPLAAVQDIARTGTFMPHKSTYFYPKAATGMVLKPLE